MDDNGTGKSKVFGFDFSKLMEHWGPTVLVGVIVVYANSAVTQAQMTELRNQVSDLRTQVFRLDDKVSEQNGKLIGLNAQVASYLGQQTQLNTAMDTRMTYLERMQRGMPMMDVPRQR